MSFEDLLGGPPQNSDFDYNDDAFVFPNLSVTRGDTPIPGALPLFATGLGVMGLLVRRRKRKNACGRLIEKHQTDLRKDRREAVFSVRAKSTPDLIREWRCQS